MSRIGKKPISIPQGVTVAVDGDRVRATGPRGNLSIPLRGVSVEVKDGKVFVVPAKAGSPESAALWGLHRALIANIITGVEKGFEKKLELEGVGYRATLQGDELTLSLGFVNPIVIQKPEGISFAVEKNVITVSGIDKAAVGQIAAQIRQAKKVEPYKRKGIRYQGETVRRKEGKKVVAAKK